MQMKLQCDAAFPSLGHSKSESHGIQGWRGFEMCVTMLEISPHLVKLNPYSMTQGSTSR